MIQHVNETDLEMLEDGAGLAVSPSSSRCTKLNQPGLKLISIKHFTVKPNLFIFLTYNAIHLSII